MELIWNSLDADSKNIGVRAIDGSLSVGQITVEDDGNGYAEYLPEEV
jgi:DNA mismatch repair ATPase MutL